jgi:hypothetical protein
MEQQQEAVPVSSLNVNELDRLRQRLEDDVEHLLESNTLLGRAVARSEAASTAVATLGKSQPGGCVRVLLLYRRHRTPHMQQAEALV